MSDEELMLIIVFTLGGFGLICSLLSLWIIFHQKVLHNAFGLICAFHSFVEAGIFCFFVFIATLANVIDPSLGQSLFMTIIADFFMFFHYAATYFQFLKSINRSFAIVFPLNYQALFTIKKTLIFMVLIAFLSLLHIIHHFNFPCNIYYLPLIYSWTYRNLECAQSLAYFINFGTKIGIMIVTLLCDIITIFYLHKVTKTITVQNKQKMARETRFFFQACLTSLFYGVMLVGPHILKPYSTTLFMGFVISTPFWLFFHSMNEFMFIIFIIRIDKKLKVSPQLNTIIKDSNKPANNSTLMYHRC